MRPEWLSLSKVASILGVHPSTVRNWSDQGVLPVHRTKGGHRRYLRSEIDLWMELQKTDGNSEVIWSSKTPSRILASRSAKAG